MTPANLGDRQYLLQIDEFGSIMVAGGPFSPYDDTQFEQCLIESLKAHPWDDSTTYQVLLVDANGLPDIEVLNDEYYAGIITEAWGTDQDLSV